MNGVLVIDKPEGFTSFDVLASLRGPMRTRRLGHTGTLDPMATGVLPVLVGCATKAADLLPDSGKAYRASFALGLTTDTQDATGTVLSRQPVSVTRAALERACEPLRGEILQLPPMYSAVRKDGVRLYELARRGVVVERTPRPVTVAELTVERFDEAAGAGGLFIRCSKGTYVRTLIHDLGAALGCGAVMTALRRTFACGFSETDALPLERARRLAAEGGLEPLLRPVDSLFDAFPALTVTGAQAARFNNGGALDGVRVSLPRGADAGMVLRVYSPENVFLGLGRLYGNPAQVRVWKLFRADG